MIHIDSAVSAALDLLISKGISSVEYAKILDQRALRAAKAEENLQAVAEATAREALDSQEAP